MTKKAPAAKSTCLGCSRSTSIMGERCRDPLSSCWVCWAVSWSRLKAGVSSSLSCMYIASPMRMMLARKGIRHPQAPNCSEESVAESTKKNAFPRTSPTGTPIWAKLP